MLGPLLWEREIMKNPDRGTVNQRLKWTGITFLLFALTIAAGWGIYKLPAPLVDRMLQTDILKQAELWKRRVVLHLDDPEMALRTGNIDDHDLEFLSSMPEASDVYRFKLLDTAGRVVWSTRANEIGSMEERAFFRSDVAPRRAASASVLHAGLRRPAPTSW